MIVRWVLTTALVASACSVGAPVTAQAQAGRDGAAAAAMLPAWEPSRNDSKKAPAGPIQLLMRGLPGWFRIGVPAGWQLGADRLSGRVQVAGAEGRSVRMWPVFLPRPLDKAGAASLLRALNAQIAPKAPWPPVVVEQTGTRMVASASVRDGDVTRATGLTLFSADGVTLALHVVANAPSRIFRQNRDLFAAVMESFVPLPGYVAGDPDLEPITFERWTDPIERAFSLDVPKGWTLQGGTIRKAAIDVRQTVQLTSPDRSILIVAGDADIPLFVEPSAEQGERDVLTAMRFQRGDEFGRGYLAARARSLMPDLAVDTARPLPQLQARLQATLDAFAGAELDRRIEPGELLFHGSLAGRPAKGYLYAATSRIRVPGRDPLWSVGDLGSLQGFIAVEDRIATAVAVIGRMGTSFETNPQWFRDNLRAIGAISQVTAQARQHVAATIEATFGPPRANAAARYARYKVDVVPIRDPQSETDHMVQVGSNYYWLDERGALIGSGGPGDADPLWIREILRAAP
jgi:hypothetical protein